MFVGLWCRLLPVCRIDGCRLAVLTIVGLWFEWLSVVLGLLASCLSICSVDGCRFLASMVAERWCRGSSDFGVNGNLCVAATFSGVCCRRLAACDFDV